MRGRDNTVFGLVWAGILVLIVGWFLLKWIIIAAVAAVAGVVYVVELLCKKKAAPVDIDSVDMLDTPAFKRLVADMLKKNGYTRVRQADADNFGVDIVAVKDGQTVAFRCKCYKRRVGVQTVQEVLGGLQRYRAVSGVVVTNSFFTNDAKQLADRQSVALWDRSVLIRMLGSDSKPKARKELLKGNNNNQARRLPPQSAWSGHLEVNQLTPNVYVIGKDIPAGTYNFICVYGGGSISKYTDETTLLGANNFLENVGSQYEYQFKECVGVVCREGEYLHINGNVVVEIERAQPVRIDL